MAFRLAAPTAPISRGIRNALQGAPWNGGLFDATSSTVTICRRVTDQAFERSLNLLNRYTYRGRGHAARPGSGRRSQMLAASMKVW